MTMVPIKGGTTGRIFLLFICFVAVLFTVISRSDFAQDHHAGEENEAHDEYDEHEVEHGPHGGRLLMDGNVQVELAIFETGVPPEFRAWIHRDGELVSAEEVNFHVELRRLGGTVDRIDFVPHDDYLLGEQEVTEPHSFDVQVVANLKGNIHQWEYESHEGRVTIAPDIAQKAGIVADVAGGQNLHQHLNLFGKTVVDPQQISHIRARYPGMIKQVNVSLGDQVEKGDTLLQVEANNSLQNYSITSPIAGTVIQRHANPGEVTADNELLTIANYQQLWVELNVFPSQAALIKAGQTVSVNAGERQAQTQIRYLTPTEHGGPSILARATLDNREHRWTPDLMVQGAVTVNQFEVPLAVDNRALQSFRDWTVVFIQVDDTYEIRPLTLGRDDGLFTEVLAGLNPGDRYVVENSYLIKADLEKSGAAHHHH